MPFIIKEISGNLTILNELTTQEVEVLDLLKEEEKFTTFLKGIKALFQIATNLSDSIELLDLIDTKYAMDFEVFFQQLKQTKGNMQQILDILDQKMGISANLMKTQGMRGGMFGGKPNTDEFSAYDGDSNNDKRFLGSEEQSSIQRDKFNNICSLCATYISPGEDKDIEKQELHLPERRLVFNNNKEEQQTYHNYCINLWINKINPNPN